MDKADRERIKDLIRDAVARDRGVIASEIAPRIKRELGIELSNKEINAYRKLMSINAFALWDEDIRKRIMRGDF